jgi:hypothetical protein
MRFELTQKQRFFLGVLGMAFTIVSIVLVYELDTIVHGLLYEYGLVFDYGWASPYWMIQRSLLVLLAILFTLNFVPTAFLVKAMLLPLFGRKHLQVKSTGGNQLQSTITLGNKDEEAKPPQNSASNQELTGAIEVSAVPMICNKCGKVFNQPLCMFDFRTGNPRLVHVCPYCNAVLAVAGSPAGK